MSSSGSDTFIVDIPSAYRALAKLAKGFDFHPSEIEPQTPGHSATHGVTIGVQAQDQLALDGEIIAGYVSLSTGSVRPDEAPKRLARGTPRYPIGTIPIARLADDLRYHRQRLGSRLLAEALRRAVAASDAAAARLVVVGAIDVTAAAFYRRWGFIDTPDNPLRLYREMSDIRASLTPPQADPAQTHTQPVIGSRGSPARSP